MTDIVTVPRTDIVQTNFLTSAESIAKEVVATKNFKAGFQFVREVYEMKNTLDDGAGMVLNEMAGAWVPEEQEGESFEQASLRLANLHPETVRRHLKIQEAIPHIPEPYREEIRSLGVKSKIQIAEAVLSGYEISDEDYRDLAEAVDEREVGRICRKVKNVEPRSNWYSLVVDQNGRVFINTIRGCTELFRMPVESDDPDVQKGIDAIISGRKIKPVVDY